MIFLAKVRLGDFGELLITDIKIGQNRFCNPAPKT